MTQLLLLEATTAQPKFITEIWKPVVQFAGYEASSFGRFRSSRRILEGTRSNNGYLHIAFSSGKKQHWKLAHRIIAEAFLEKPTDHHCVVNHKDSNRMNNHCDNLEWSTRSWNTKHAFLRKKNSDVCHNFQLMQ